MNPCDTAGQYSGWVMDGFGGLHPFAAAGTPMPAVPDTTGYWPGWTIANDFVAFCITVGGVQHAAGCVLDGFGGLHPWADSSAVIGDVSCNGTGYWPGWDIATKIAVIPGTDQGYVMDGFGGLHPFNGAPLLQPVRLLAGLGDRRRRGGHRQRRLHGGRLRGHPPLRQRPGDQPPAATGRAGTSCAASPRPRAAPASTPWTPTARSTPPAAHPPSG